MWDDKMKYWLATARYRKSSYRKWIQKRGNIVILSQVTRSEYMHRNG